MAERKTDLVPVFKLGFVSEDAALPSVDNALGLTS